MTGRLVTLMTCTKDGGQQRETYRKMKEENYFEKLCSCDVDNLLISDYRPVLHVDLKTPKVATCARVAVSLNQHACHFMQRW